MFSVATDVGIDRIYQMSEQKSGGQLAAVHRSWMEFGRWLKNIRVKHGMTQSEFADTLYISKAVIAKAESAINGPSPDLLVRVALTGMATLHEAARASGQYEKMMAQLPPDAQREDFGAVFASMSPEGQQAFRAVLTALAIQFPVVKPPPQPNEAPDQG